MLSALLRSGGKELALRSVNDDAGLGLVRARPLATRCTQQRYLVRHPSG
jgi:hypothetical protein